MKLLLIFIALNVANVIIQTIKNIVTINGGKWSSSIINALAWGLYTILLVYINLDLGLWVKVGIVAASNLVGVYIVKWFEERQRKDQLWKVEFTIKSISLAPAVANALEKNNIPYNRISTLSDYVIFNAFCATQKESQIVKNIITEYGAKYFVSETKAL